MSDGGVERETLLVAALARRCRRNISGKEFSERILRRAFGPEQP
jgi:hypothetical protein